MYRVYTLVGSYRYYWCGSHWSQWSFSAKTLTLAQATELAKAERAQFEKIEKTA